MGIKLVDGIHVLYVVERRTALAPATAALPGQPQVGRNADKTIIPLWPGTELLQISGIPRVPAATSERSYPRAWNLPSFLAM